MAGEGNVARLVITVDNKGALQAIRQTADEVNKGTGKIVTSEAKVQKANEESALSFRRLRDATIGALGFFGLTFGLRDVVSAGLDFQEQQGRLQVALRNTGQNVGVATDAIMKNAEALSQHGGFALTEQLPMITRLVAETGNYTTALHLNKAATELSRGTGLEYSRAIKIVQNAMAGQGRSVQRYVGVIIPATQYTHGWTAAMKAANPAGWAHAQMLNKQATAAQVLAAIQHKYAGQTDKYSHSMRGVINTLKNTLEGFMVTLGTTLLPLVAKFLTAVSQVLVTVTSHFGTIKAVFYIAFAPLFWVITLLVKTRIALWALMLVFAGFAVVHTYIGMMNAFAFSVAKVRQAYHLLKWVYLSFIASEKIGTAWTWLQIAALNVAAFSARAFAIALDAIPFVALAAVVALVIYEIVTHWKWFESTVLSIFKTVGNFFINTFHSLEHIAVVVVNKVAKAFEWLGGALTRIWKDSPLGGIFGFASNLVSGHVGSAFGSLARGFTFGAVGDWGVGGGGHHHGGPQTQAVATARNSSVPIVRHRVADVHTTVPVVLNLDGRHLAEATVQHTQRMYALSGRRG